MSTGEASIRGQGGRTLFSLLDSDVANLIEVYEQCLRVRYCRGDPSHYLHTSLTGQVAL